jgi:hypothetical protein
LAALSAKIFFATILAAKEAMVAVLYQCQQGCVESRQRIYLTWVARWWLGRKQGM